MRKPLPASFPNPEFERSSDKIRAGGSLLRQAS